MRPRFNWQALVTLAVLLVVGFLVLLPVVFLVEESLNTGDPMAFPPEQYGIANYIAMFDEDLQVLTNTVIIAVAATVMAILIGFTLACEHQGNAPAMQAGGRGAKGGGWRTQHGCLLRSPLSGPRHSR